MIEVDQSNTIDRNFDPMVFVYGNEYNLDLNVLSESIVLEESGERTYLLQVSSPGAYGIGLNFDNFYLTENSKLFIYDIERTYFLGSLTNVKFLVTVSSPIVMVSFKVFHFLVSLSF